MRLCDPLPFHIPENKPIPIITRPILPKAEFKPVEPANNAPDVAHPLRRYGKTSWLLVEAWNWTTS
jgi:hypothetical protein